MSTIENPCIRKCCLNEHDVCLGCFRIFDDMLKWNKATHLEKEQMLVLAKERKKRYLLDRKGFKV